MSRELVLARIPHRPPFLLVDEVVEETPGRAIHTRRRLDPEDPVFQGHYPGFPLYPGALVCEALYQSGAILLAGRADAQLDPERVPVLHRTRDARFRAMVRPGDVLDLFVEVEDALGGLFHLKGSARVGEVEAVSARFSLAAAPRPGIG